MGAWSMVRPRPRQRPAPAAAAVRRPVTDDQASAPWRTLCPADARVLRDPDPRLVRRIPSGRTLVLVSDRMWGRRRLRRAARIGGLVVDRELLVLPGTRHTLVTVDEDPQAVHHLWHSVAAVPPGLTWASLPLTGLLLLARRLPWQWTGAVLGGHVLVGRRP